MVIKAVRDCIMLHNCITFFLHVFARFLQVPFDHPLFIMYSSGTTGMPKCMVHSVGGTLIKHLEEHQIQGNRSPDDVLMYYTTTGWMMWNWMVTALAIGTMLLTIVTYQLLVLLTAMASCMLKGCMGK